jgi:transcriptional regulator with XRE-family HTH domain
VSQQTVSRWERGEALPRRGRVELLANALDVEAAIIARYAGSLAAAAGDDSLSFRHLYERIDSLTDTELALLVERAWSTLRGRMSLGLTRACT